MDYMNRFKSETEMVTRLFGKRLVDGYHENKQEYKDLPATDFTGRK